MLQNQLRELPDGVITDKHQHFLFIIISLITVIIISLSILIVYIRFKNIFHKIEEEIIS